MSNIDRMNHFEYNPTNLDISRSRFPRSFTHKTTFSSSKLIPIFWDEVVPGDSFDVNTSAVVRMLTPAVPVMDNAYMDIYYFFVPSRLCTVHEHDWAKVMGENRNTAWAPASESTIYNTGNSVAFASINSNPSVGSDKLHKVFSGSAMNYMGLPIMDYTNVGKDSSGTVTDYLNAMPLIAYQQVWNEYFRSGALQAPITNYLAGITNNGSGYFVNLAQDCLPVCKLSDYFVNALPSPQRGESVFLPLGNLAPVITGDRHAVKAGYAMTFKDTSGSVFSPAANTHVDLTVTTPASSNIGRLTASAASSGSSGTDLLPDNLYADLANATAASVNSIRQAFAIQRMLEKDARGSGGGRYREMLKVHFGVTLPDATAQVPEYLGGKRIPLNISQVLQTAETSTTPLGYTGAFSNTSMHDKSFFKSFSEFGYIIGVACVRTLQSYSQGIHKAWTRNRRFDFYFPSFANLGEMPVYTKELYASADSDRVFGYQEAWAEYRYHPNMVTGNLAPAANDSTLAPWTYTSNLDGVPVLNSDFIVQSETNIGDTLIDKTTTTQFVADFFFDVKTTRPMPVFSIPGLIDHH